MQEPLDELQRLIGPSLSRRAIERYAFAHDASLYRLVPQAVVRPISVDEISTVLSWCHRHGMHSTFRTGGTSLSGQAVTSGVLIDLSRGWQRVEILDGGQRVRMQPGITGARVNAMLHRYGRKLGPDPASLMAAMIGGIVANNASGMCCGTAQNSYHTLDSMAYMLVDGTRIDTASLDADEHLRSQSLIIYDALLQLRDEIRADEELTALIRRKYRIKNTIGYSLNAFLDEDEPARILARLLIGSEGTLGFIEKVTLNTVADARQKWTTLIVYDTLDDACASVESWRASGAAAIELMDDASLRSFAQLPTTPTEYRIDRKGAAALLVEFHDAKPPAMEGIRWTSDPKDQVMLWKLRKGLMPTVGAMRKAGQTMINEDIAVPPEHLASLVRDVQTAFVEFDYHDGIVFGHAKDGNIHFVVCQDFSIPSEIDRYAAFMERIAEIVVDRYAGSLKAEHGTGRNMAPFVAREWGKRAYEIMQRIKSVLDPSGILNPDVVINADPLAHVRNIKPVPPLEGDVAAIADRCIECGFCEHVCPTREVTLTPRQRIVIERELIMPEHSEALRRELARQSRFDVEGSCAVDGICATVCPVGIDTGAMVKVRRRSSRRIAGSLAHVVGRNMHRMRSISRFMLQLRFTAFAPGASLLKGLGVPAKLPVKTASDVDVIYVPTCVSRTFVHETSQRSLPEMITELAAAAGLRLSILTETHGCCGQPLSSQGHTDAAAESAGILLDDVVRLRGDRNVPVLLDASTCSAALRSAASYRGIDVIDQVGFVELVLSRIDVPLSDQPLVIHAGCGAAKQGSAERLTALANKLSSNVIVPPSATCCGMGGTHGLLHPEIVTAATAAQRIEILAHPSFDQNAIGISLNTLCESALSSTTGVRFKGLVEVVWRRMTDDR
jgi:D-lactate dehydrogenase